MPERVSQRWIAHTSGSRLGPKCFFHPSFFSPIEPVWLGFSTLLAPGGPSNGLLSGGERRKRQCSRYGCQLHPLQHPRSTFASTSICSLRLSPFSFRRPFLSPQEATHTPCQLGLTYGWDGANTPVIWTLRSHEMESYWQIIPCNNTDLGLLLAGHFLQSGFTGRLHTQLFTPVRKPQFIGL